jgi:hypothetical protein
MADAAITTGQPLKALSWMLQAVDQIIENKGAAISTNHFTPWSFHHLLKNSLILLYG